ncbi:MAG: N-acetylneuraminate synthase family protein [Planctomycetota bacterium]
MINMVAGGRPRRHSALAAQRLLVLLLWDSLSIEEQMRFVALIPARGGSKGVSRKNLVVVGGRTLVARAIHTARACKAIARVIVSTDDQAIAAEARRAGAEVPFMRPPELAADNTPTLPVMEHAARWLLESGDTFDAMVLLQATSPLRTAADIEVACAAFANGDADSLVTIMPVPHEHHPEWTFYRRDDNLLVPATSADGTFRVPTRRQSLREAWHRDGAVYITRRETLLGGSIYGERVFGLLPGANTHRGVNIDTPEDLQAARRAAFIIDGPRTIVLGDRTIGPGRPCLIIAEVAQAHDGSLGTAHAYIDAAAKAGADAVKFQTHIADAESSAAEQFRVRFSKQDTTRKDYWRRMEFSREQWQGLAEHARGLGLIFLSSPFSEEAVELLEGIGVPAWKVASGEITTLPLLRRMIATGVPMLFSSGMSRWDDLDTAVCIARAGGVPFALMQCTTAYPCPPERIGLNVMSELRERYAVPVGLSDHSGTIHSGVAAVALGANLLEVHITFSRDSFGPDVPASLTTAELAELVRGVRFVEKALHSPVDKEVEAEVTAELRATFGKRVVAARDLPAGHVLTVADLACKKPGVPGIPAARLDAVVGRTLRRPLGVDDPIDEESIA